MFRYTADNIMESKKKALLIGINYTGQPIQLYGCINDVMSMKDTLTSNYNYNDSNILVLTDNTTIKPTRSNIISAFRWLVTDLPASGFRTDGKYPTTQQAPMMYFHYAGHGILVPDDNGDEASGYDSSIVPVDYTTVGVIRDDVIRYELANMVITTLVGVLDCCYCGTGFDLRWNYGIDGSVTEDQHYPPTDGNVIVISAGNDRQKANDVSLNGGNHGALSYALKNVINAGGSMELVQLVADLNKFIQTRGLARSEPQTPSLSSGRKLVSGEIFRL